MLQPNSTLKIDSHNLNKPPILIEYPKQGTAALITVQENAPPTEEDTGVEEEKREDFHPAIYLQHLSDMFHGKHTYMLEMLNILLQQIPTASKKMEEAIKAENWQDVFFQSHRIKSTLKIVGLDEWVNVCIEIESRTRNVLLEEIYLVADFFEQFQMFQQTETPRLEASVVYLQEQIAQETVLVEAPPMTDTACTTKEITSLLP